MEEKTLLKAVLCFLVTPDGRFWLATKTAKIGAGCLNGYGGGIEPGETAEQAVAREVFEEAKVKADPSEFKKVGVVYFRNHKSDGSIFVCEVHVYTLATTQVPMATPEMANPQSFLICDVGSIAPLMPADPYWLPYVFQDKLFLAWAEYAPKQQALLKPVRVEIVTVLPAA